MRRTIDILSAGELLVDFATAEFSQTVEEALLFKRSPSGSAANIAVQMARLGNKAYLAATVGNDDMGQVLISYLNRMGVDTSCIAQVEEPTSLILTTRAGGSHRIQAYRGADGMLSIRQFPFQDFDNIGIFHTTCFALSKKTAQPVIYQAAERAHRAGCSLSIDINFSSKIFPDRMEAKKAVSEICRYKALVVLTEADWLALYEDNAPSAQAVIEHFLKIGATEVCFIGKNNCWAGGNGESAELGLDQTQTFATELFWAAYLTARLDGKSLQECLLAGKKMTELKVPATEAVDRNILYDNPE